MDDNDGNCSSVNVISFIPVTPSQSICFHTLNQLFAKKNMDNNGIIWFIP